MRAGVVPSPGTVSRLLWHFTGGPVWDAKQQRQSARRKSSKSAYNALVSILRTRELRLASYAETVRLVVPFRRRYDVRSRQVIEERNIPVTLRCAPVCCLADIPVAHLAYHSHRYGRFAIGFHRGAVTEYGFNPVLYTLEETDVIRSIYAGLSGLDGVDASEIESGASEIESAADDLEDDAGSDISSCAQDIQMEASNIEQAVDDAKESLQRLLAFVKTFRRDEFDTIYCEREWRCLEAFKFTYDQLAMIVLPKGTGTSQYFERFLATEAAKLKIPRRIPIVSWEDLVEH